MKPESKQTLYRNVSAFFAIFFLAVAITLSFITHLIAAPVIGYVLALLFYGVFLRAQLRGITYAWLLAVDVVIAMAGLLSLFILTEAGALMFMAALAPLVMFAYRVPRWTTLVATIYIVVFTTILLLPPELTQVNLSTINVKTALLLTLLLPACCLPALAAHYGEWGPGESAHEERSSEREMLNAVATLFYRLRTSLNNLQGAMQLLKSDEPLDREQQKAVREMLDESVVSLNDMVNSLFVTKSLSNESVLLEQFNLHSKIKNRVMMQFASLGLDDTPSFSFDPSVPQLVEGDGAYADQAIERILGGILYDNLTTHEHLSVSTLILGAPRGDSLLVKVEFECGNLSSHVISDDSLFGEENGAFLGSLRIRRTAHGVSVSFTMPLTVVTKARRQADVVEVSNIQAKEPKVSGASLLAQAHVLIVEDNAINRRVMKITLQNVVASIAVAEDGQEAVEQVSNNCYDLILMDVQMPIMDGYAAAKAIRALEKERGGRVPIIALTAYALRGDRERCLAAGMDTYIAKPFKKEALLAIMARELGKACQKKPTR